ncbi:8-hydroxyquercetin 8-O-methyltransferase-like [Salvia miltiorrhiza]|uniref:8-hydroxyquercetin 8-O-methyltransferase-like n=1 Tax=Salvia miltiorrhiza TaxID=226208 RepID=UPI0025AD4D3E|nr:8-hydroxyquercetin 8-O-methyltransferase-like [Salvia miltiorrhiza]
MALPNAVDSTQEFLDAQTHVWNLTFNYINSMSLKSALLLGIPDIIHKHGKPITLSQLADALSINNAKSHGLYRLMRFLVHSRIFDKVNISDDEEEAYSLTTTSRLLLRDEPLSFAPFALAMTDPIIVDPFHNVMEWFKDESPSPFVTRNGMNFWENANKDKNFNQVFNKGMASDARFVGSILVDKCKHVFEGLKTVVDVGGGTGTVAKIVADAFSGLKCVVLELPHVVAGLEGSENLSFVSGDMFDSIPSADAVFLKWIFHDWGDEDSVKILEKCKEAILPSKESGGKVIIVEIVLDYEKQEDDAIETQLSMDMLMMTLLTGKERTEKEWAKLFYAAGFQNYKITPILGLRSVIEVFP